MKLLRRCLSVILCIAMAISILPATNVKAAATWILTDQGPRLEKTADIDNVVTGKYYANIASELMSGMNIAIPIDLTSEGNCVVKILFGFAKDLTSSYCEAYICKEQDLNSSQRITDIQTINKQNTTFNVFLDGGQKYYMVLDWTNRERDSGDDAFLYTDDMVTLAIAYEVAISSEVSNSTSFANPTPLSNGKTANGFITQESPNDYYVFSVSKDEMVNLYYTFDGKGNTSGTGTVEIMSQDKELLKTSSVRYSDTSRSTEVEVDLGTLKAGAYFVKLTGLYGATTLRYETKQYTINLSKSATGWTHELTVYVDTDISSREMVYVKGHVAESDKTTASFWREATRISDSKFVVTENGEYTVRIYGSDQSYTLGYITIDNIDGDVATVTGVADGGAYRSGRNIRFSDSVSGISTAKLGNFNILSGARVSDEGSYSLVIEDKAGNELNYNFFIDYTKPKCDGVVSGKTYSEAVTLKFSDALSGLGSVTIDDTAFDISRSTTTSISNNGEHTVVVKDVAGNTLTVKFTIKR